MEQKNNDSPAEPESDRREALQKLGRLAAYAAPFTLLATPKKAAAATGVGPDGT
jgi:hypothetical protein